MEQKGKPGPKDATLPNKVLEYYRIYSQNNKLSKYFSGTYDTDMNAQFKPTYVSSSQEAGDFASPKLSPAQIPIISIDDTALDKNREPSPTSSITANRKLEWDNGADIGYDNCGKKTIHKSVSLPILSNYEIQGQCKYSMGKCASSDTSSNANQEIKPSSSSSSEPIKKSFIYSTSSSSSNAQISNKIISSTSSEPIQHYESQLSTSSNSDVANATASDVAKDDVLHFIRSKVGVPAAESTPYSHDPIIYIDSGTSNSSSNGCKVTSDAKPSTSNVVKDMNSREVPTHSFKSQDVDKLGTNKFSEVIGKGELHTPKIAGKAKDQQRTIQNILTLIENAEQAVLSDNKSISENRLDSLGDVYTNTTTVAEQCGNNNDEKLKCSIDPFKSKNHSKKFGKYLGIATFHFEVVPPMTSANDGDFLTGFYDDTMGVSKVPMKEETLIRSSPPISDNKSIDSNMTVSLKSTSNKPTIPNKVVSSSLENLTASTDETMRKWNSQKDLTLAQRVKYFNRYRNKKIENLRLTRPVCVECINSSVHQDKNVQTSSDNISIGIQTEMGTSSRKSDKHQQGVVYMFHPYNKHYNSSNSTTQTNSDVVFSNCNSFEFLNGSACDKNSNSLKSSNTNKTSATDKSVEELLSQKLKRSTVKTDLTNVNTDKSTSSSNENYLSDLLAHQKSQLYDDIERKLGLLQKLNKSRKYDDETKRYYIKKILKSILKNNYSEDSSVHSEQITPKISTKIPYREHHVYKDTTDKPYTYDNTNSSQTTRDNRLKNNVPWVPIAPNTEEGFPVNYTMKINASENKSEKPNTERSQRVKDPRFTLPHGIVNYPYRAQIQKGSTTESSSGTLNKQEFFLPNQQKQSNTSYENLSWKENKTLSERLLERRQYELSSGDSPESPNEQLLFFAKRERENQLNWINNEIQHLTKLKGLLEHKKEEQGDVAKVNINKIRNVKKSTAIYMITTEKPDVAKEKSASGNGGVNDTAHNSQIASSDYSQVKFRLCTANGIQDYRVNEIKSKSTFEQLNGEVLRSNNDTSSIKEAKEAQTIESKDIAKPNSKEGKAVSDNKNRKLSKHQTTRPSSVGHSRAVKVNDNSCSKSNPNNMKSTRLTSVNLDNAVLISNDSKPGEKVRTVVYEVPVESTTSIQDEGEQNKQVQTSKSLLDQTASSTSSSSSLRSSTSSSSSEVLCSCCRKYVAANESSLGFNSEIFNDITPPPFCEPCFNECKKKPWNPENPFYAQPQHKCNCHNVNVSAMEKIRTTLKELHDLEVRENYCKCMSRKLSRQGEGVSIICQCKKHRKSSKKPVAYLLTFEPGEFDLTDMTHKVKSLEEIRVKVPNFNGKHKRDSAGDIEENKKDKYRKHKQGKRKNKKTLQDYLEMNNPSFIKGAEERRKCMIDLAYMREQRCQKYKQLLALTNGIPMQNPGYSEIHQKRLFTSKEMKGMTAKKYKQLPEVQQKLVENRNNELKKANRLLADIFNKKLRERVLRGNPTVSASTSVINLM